MKKKGESPMRVYVCDCERKQNCHFNPFLR